MTTYAIFYKEFDCEVWVTLKVGDRESIDTIKELLFYEIEDKGLDSGYIESYPFFQADWEIVGGRLDRGFDFDQVMEVNT